MTEPKRYKSAYSLQTALANHIRERFIYCRRQKAASLNRQGVDWKPGVRWDGGELRGRTHKPFWLRCVPAFHAKQLPPAEYVSFVVFDLTARGLPDPPELLKPSSLAAFNDSETFQRPRRLERHEVWLQSQMAMLRAYLHEIGELAQTTAAITPDQIRRASLVDEELPLTPLFRYCMARQHGLDDLSPRFAYHAANQYVCESRYFDEVWKGLIPEDFRKRALQLFGL